MVTIDGSDKGGVSELCEEGPVDGVPAGAQVVPRRRSQLARLRRTAEQAQDFAGRARAPNTIKAYRSDWSHFEAWAFEHGLEVLPADPRTLVLYLTECAGWLKASTIGRRLSSISQAHKAAGHSSPTKDALVQATWAGIRRTIGTAEKGKAPIRTADLRRMVEDLAPTLRGRRDRALLVLGFAGGFRRSELVGLDVNDLEETADGVVVTIRRSKTDQEGQGRQVGIPYGSNPLTCPVRALRTWLDASALEQGPLFRAVDRYDRVGTGRLSDKTVALVIKRQAVAAGLDPSRLAGHSLRAGLATSAAAAGVSERVIMDQTGHRSVAVLRKYIREGSLFRENAAARVGL